MKVRRLMFAALVAASTVAACSSPTEVVYVQSEHATGCDPNDGSALDATTDAFAEAAGDDAVAEAAAEAGDDAVADALAEASGDDAPTEAASEAGLVDAQADVVAESGPGDAQADAVADASSEAAAEAGSEAGSEAGVDAGPTPYVRQWAQDATHGNSTQDRFAALAQPVLAGSTLVAFVTEYNISGSPAGSGTPGAITLTDGSGVAYTQLYLVKAVSDLQAVWMFYRPNVAASSGPLTLHVHFGGLEFQGAGLVEVAGVSAAPLVTSASNLFTAAKAGVDRVKMPTMTVGAAPSLVVALFSDVTSENPIGTVGTGYALVGNVWDWQCAESACGPHSTIESKLLAAPGTAAPTYTPGSTTNNPPGDNYANVAIVLH